MEKDPTVPYIEPINNVSQWQFMHQMAYWKSRAIALEYENRMLHQHLRDAYANIIFEYEQDNRPIEDGHDSPDEAINKQLRDHYNTLLLCESSKPPQEQISKKRQKQVTHLYGEMAPKINGMETAVQLNYDLNIEKYNPKHWPHLPFKP